MKQVQIYTDGACSGNPGVGGWAAIMLYKGHEKVLSGAEKDTTNNRMELTAIIEGLSALKEKCEVSVCSDSSYSIDPFVNGWIWAWQMKGWRNTAGDVKNVDLWEKLLALSKKHKVEFVKVKGHSDNALNNRCDKLAKEEIKKLNIAEAKAAALAPESGDLAGGE